MFMPAAWAIARFEAGATTSAVQDVAAAVEAERVLLLFPVAHWCPLFSSSSFWGRVPFKLETQPTKTLV